MRINLLLTFVFLAVCQALPASAQSPQIKCVGNAQQQGYMVSIILRRNDDATVIKLIHGLSIGASKEVAVDTFVRNALIRYAGYTVIESLSTQVPGANCGQAI